MDQKDNTKKGLKIVYIESLDNEFTVEMILNRMEKMIKMKPDAHEKLKALCLNIGNFPALINSFSDETKKDLEHLLSNVERKNKR